MKRDLQDVAPEAHSQPGKRVAEESATPQWQGLSEEEAAKRLLRDGFNELPSSQARSLWGLAIDLVREPMLLLLIGTGAVYLVLGDPTEAAALLVAIFGIIGITLYQERKTERALHALRDLSSPRALVIRQGTRKRIAGREVVPGDLVVISEGDRIPADGIILECRNVHVDESLLTGESVPVPKLAGTPNAALGRPGGDNTPNVFSGTLVVKGRGIVEVRATGLGSELGKIGTSLASLRAEDTQIQKETNRLVKIFAVLGVLLCAIVVLVFGYTHSNWLRGVLAGLTLAISMVPEEFPVVLTIFLAMGAWRISRQRVLTRRMPAIETLGAATVLCVDKTGTLTMNRMRVQMLYSGGLDSRAQWWNLRDMGNRIPDAFHETVEYSILASSRDPFDPMEKAFIDLGQDLLQSTEHLHPDWELAREYALSPKLLAMSRAWNVPDTTTRCIAAKGAPEAIAQLCRLSPDKTAQLTLATAQMAGQGLRVLGVAKAAVQGDLPIDQEMIPFQLVGLVGLADPVRPSVPEAIQECYRAGIRVIMVTGDYPVTAQNIAAQIGLQHPDLAITGAELEEMDDAQLAQRVRNINVFARVVPEQKLRLVNALKSSGEVVAMTGDGVNDAPALKAADIGIAMGSRGTDVAREAAALVLLDDDFSSIVNAIRLGRRIYDNLKKATAFVLAVHVPIAGVTLVPLLLGWPLLLIPVNVVFLELIIDPACSIAFEAEPEEANVMARPPRRATERLFERKRVMLSLLQGFGVLVTTLAVYGAFLYFGHSEADSRGVGFSALVMGNLALIFTNRSWTRTIWQSIRAMNTSLWVISAGTTLSLLLVLYVPLLRNLFHFSVLHPSDVLIAVLAGFFGVMWFETLKLVHRRGRITKNPTEANK
ncbi:MAG: cation-translocating P-type ATPase [Acidobacteriia bacterium]|nr:cation-translocating P-type ATPase [Terriglobia bacterium]